MAYALSLVAIAILVLAALSAWRILRRARARMLAHQISDMLEAIEAQAPRVDPSPQRHLDYDFLLLGPGLAGSVGNFFASASPRDPAFGVEDRRRVSELGEATLRALRDVATGRRHDLVSRA